jgi:hypothetical protein
MTRHLVTLAIAAFWLVMVTLLWRAETGHGNASAPVPLDVVVERIVNASDSSQLRLLHRGKELGQLRWVASIQERSPAPDESTPEGMVRVVEGYRIDIDLNLHGDAPDQRWRVIAQVEMGPDKSIKDVLLRWIQRPMAWEVHMRAGSDTIEWVEENGREIRRRDSFKLSDLSRLREAVGPVAGLIPIPWPTPGTAAAGGNAAGPWVEWFAADEPMVAGRHKVRTFKVRARVLGQFDIVAHVSRAGEILRVSLPDQYLLASTALPGLESPSRR